MQETYDEMKKKERKWAKSKWISLIRKKNPIIEKQETNKKTVNIKSRKWHEKNQEMSTSKGEEKRWKKERIEYIKRRIKWGERKKEMSISKGE